MNLFAWSWAAAFAVAIGLTSTANARVAATKGNTICVGVIEKYGSRGWSNAGFQDDEDLCSFEGNTTAGKKILAVCSEGSRCRWDMDARWRLHRKGSLSSTFRQQRCAR